MNTCPECNKQLLEFEKLTLNDGEIEVCMDCFFSDIPEHPSFDDKEKEIKSKIREEAIQAKTTFLLKKYCSDNPRS